MSPTATRKATRAAGRTGKQTGSTGLTLWLKHLWRYETAIDHKLTETHQVPHIGPWDGTKHHVDQPEGVKHLDAHPGQGCEQSVVEASRHPHTHLLPIIYNIGQDASEEEEQIEEGKRNSEAQVDWRGLVLGEPATIRENNRNPVSTTCWQTFKYRESKEKGKSNADSVIYLFLQI